MSGFGNALEASHPSIKGGKPRPLYLPDRATWKSRNIKDAQQQ
jgi:hypothetical protein